MSEVSLFWRPNEELPVLQKNYKFSGRFKLLEPIGEGGFGQVWRVQDLLLDQKVALKVSIGDLTIETVALRRLPKDRYFSIFDYVQDDYFSAYAYSMELLDKPWMTIDYYEKKHLRPSFANPTKSADAVRMVILIAIDILTSLGALHGKKYGKKGNRAVHADIKPQNLYINRVRANLAHLIHGSFVLRLAGVAQCADIA